jgi:hypothetical protein
MGGRHTYDGCCLVPRRDCLWHCYHHLSAMQPLAQCHHNLASVDQSPVCQPRTLQPHQRGYVGLDFWWRIYVKILLCLAHNQVKIILKVVGYITPCNSITISIHPADFLHVTYLSSWVCFNKTVQRYIPEANHLHTACRENLKFCKTLLTVSINILHFC